MNDTVPDASAEPATVSAAPKEESKGSAVWREIKGLLWVLLAVLLFHSFVAKPFYIPSESMMPNLLKGDRLVVTKYPYGWSWVSPSFHILEHIPGRLFGRMEAKGKKNRQGEWIRPPRFTRAVMDAWLARKGVQVRGGDVDESPMVYRRLEDVLAFHKGTVKIEHTLRPFAVAMAGPGEFDPYKD